ncbi:hypothetical protein E4U53_002017 [Claviceps sorghi]|nr:hypothetical protein E4U53_002017 [Claviceps sorghi]
MPAAPNLRHLRHVLALSRAPTSRVLPGLSPRRIHSKGGQSGEQGQFKAVTASQSAHEPSQDMASKPPHEAAKRARDKRQPAQKPADKKDTKHGS